MDLHAAISLYTHGVITKEELRTIASVYYKVPLGKTTTYPTTYPSTTPYINTSPYTPPYTFPYQTGTNFPINTPVTSGFSQPVSSFTTTFSRAQEVTTDVDERPTKCACKH